MATIGLPWKDIQTMCPPDIYLSGENSQSNIMVSGPSESLKSFAKKLQMNGVFVRLLETCEFAPHSPYMDAACELLRDYLKEIVPIKTLRSSKWLATNALEEDWGSPEVQYFSDVYITNVVKNQVHFYKAVLHIPHNSVVLEISPRATLGMFVKETVPSAKYLHCIPKKDKVNPAILSKQNLQSLFNP
ncbi:unnamed protein product [Allacma fusca]|uniref:Malonyl-CoA:ACP transacylase (MAT) domain-containing protein n=1 Tax=Allacma fusca TaxID=39272 RepID=A0A8J2K3M2_9HEXA|nr:unnamed protein product [Allacma fusca]